MTRPSLINSRSCKHFSIPATLWAGDSLDSPEAILLVSIQKKRIRTFILVRQALAYVPSLKYLGLGACHVNFKL